MQLGFAAVQPLAAERSHAAVGPSGESPSAAEGDPPSGYVLSSGTRRTLGPQTFSPLHPSSGQDVQQLVGHAALRSRSS